MRRIEILHDCKVDLGPAGFYSRNEPPLRNFEPSDGLVERRQGRGQGDAMADRTGLKIVGLLFATVMLAVTLATWTVVKLYSDGIYSLDNVAVAHIPAR